MITHTSPSLGWSISRESSTSSSYDIITSFPPPPSFPSSYSPLIPMLQTAGRASYLTQPVTPTFSRLGYLSLSLVAFCVHSLLHDEFMPISHHLFRHLKKSCASAVPFVSFVFVTPKVSSIPNHLFTLIIMRVGIILPVPYHGGVGCGSGMYK